MAKHGKNGSNEPSLPKTRAQFLKLYKKGLAFNKANDHINAIKHLNKALEYSSSDPQLLIMLADSLFKIGNRQAALQLMTHALEADPNNVANVIILGNAAHGMGMLELSAKFHEHHIKLDPSDPVGYNNYATALRELGRQDDAIALLQDILPVFPKEEALWNTLGSIVSFRDGPGNALVFFEESLKLDPDNINTLNNIAPSYYSIGEVEKAEAAIRHALEIDPNSKQPNIYLSTILLRNKRLSEAWEKYQWRFDGSKIQNTINFNKIPYWKGEPLNGKKIFIFSEQGIGDEILFTWLNKQLIDEAAKVGIACNERLVPLFKSSFPEAQVGLQQAMVDPQHDIMFMKFPDFDLTEYDYQVVSGDISMFKWPDYSDIEEDASAILRPDVKKMEYWKEKITTLPKKVSVGVAWRSGIKLANRSRNYTDLLNWAPILSNKDVNFVNVQYGDCKEELDELEKETGIKIHNFEELDLRDDFEGTTAMMTALDMVIGPASAPTMQSSFAGVETWFMSSEIPFWSFGDERPKWRRNARVLHKNNNDPWPEFMAEKAEDFKNWVAVTSK